MVEYINREEMLKYIEEHNTEADWIVNQYNADWIYNFIDSRPTADVAPRSEVAREIFEEIEFDIHQLMFVSDEDRAMAIEGVIAELKKKYIKDCTTCKHLVSCEPNTSGKLDCWKPGTEKEIHGGWGK